MASRTATDRRSNILLMAANSDVSDRACFSLLSIVEPDQTHLLSVTFQTTPDELIESWRVQNGTLPAEIGAITVGESFRSAAASPSPSGPAPVRIETVPEPSDLTGLAMAIGSYLDDWAQTDHTPVVCFDSITTLLLHADQERVFRFLHTTIARLRDIGAYAHYHFNPTVHDEATENVISSLFDAVVRIDADGSLSIERQR